MRSQQRQGELFCRTNHFWELSQPNQELSLSKEFLEAWQEKVYSHQSKIFQGIQFAGQQTSLFQESSDNLINYFKPLNLTPLPINFWRYSKSPHKGQAIYIVMDKLDDNKKFIILYIGETIAAEQRWKGEHDCKTYLNNYCESLQKVGIGNNLSIRFWNDVPQKTKERRRLEQELIKIWRPPFNKETRTSWQTPFTSEIT